MGYIWICTSRIEADYTGGCIWMDMNAYFQSRSSTYRRSVYVDLDFNHMTSS
jgi:hypothetical protein